MRRGYLDFEIDTLERVLVGVLPVAGIGGNQLGGASLDHPYSVVRVVEGGATAYVSGTLPTDAEGNVVHERDGAIARMLGNLEARLGTEALTLGDVVKTTVYVTDMGWRDALNEAYVRTFPEPLPTRTMIEVRALPYGAPIEIEVIAHREASPAGVRKEERA